MWFKCRTRGAGVVEDLSFNVTEASVSDIGVIGQVKVHGGLLWVGGKVGICARPPDALRMNRHALPSSCCGTRPSMVRRALNGAKSSTLLMVHSGDIIGYPRGKAETEVSQSCF